MIIEMESYEERIFVHAKNILAIELWQNNKPITGREDFEEGFGEVPLFNLYAQLQSPNYDENSPYKVVKVHVEPKRGYYLHCDSVEKAVAMDVMYQILGLEN